MLLKAIPDSNNVIVKTLPIVDQLNDLREHCTLHTGVHNLYINVRNEMKDRKRALTVETI